MMLKNFRITTKKQLSEVEKYKNIKRIQVTLNKKNSPRYQKSKLSLQGFCFVLQCSALVLNILD